MLVGASDTWAVKHLPASPVRGDKKANSGFSSLIIYLTIKRRASLVTQGRVGVIGVAHQHVGCNLIFARVYVYAVVFT